MSELKDKTAKGLVWGGVSNGLVQVLGALFGIIMLQLLEPSDYGKIAVLLIFANIASSLQESGFIAALINRKEPTHEEYNAVFWFNIMVSTTIYIILWFASPLIARFYHEPVLTPLARYLFLGFLFSSFGTVQRAYLNGHLMVKQCSIISVVSLVLSNVIGVIMAWQGYAFWGLATQQVFFILLAMLMHWYVSPWRPSFHINLRPAWQMFGFSSKLLVTNLFNQLNSQVFSFLLGHYYNTKVVGYYSNARKWNDMASNTINGMINGQISLPVLAQVKDDMSRYRTVFRKMLRFTCFVSFPCMLGLGLIANEFILIVGGQKWAASAGLLALISIYGAFYPVQILYSNMTVSQGRSGINMFCTIALCILVWCGMIALTSWGLYSMVIFFVALNVLWLLVWQWFAWRLIRFSFLDAAKDIFPFLLVSVAVMAFTWFITQPIHNIYLLVVAKIILAALLYVALMWFSGAKIVRECFAYVLKRKK